MSPSNRILRLARCGGSVSLVALVVAAVFLASSASARPEFPGKLAADLNMPCTPSCAVCHFDSSGGPGKIRNTTNGGPGFGANLRDNYGLKFTDVNSLEPALSKLEAAKSDNDVDGDGTSDIDELKKGEDPNDPAPGASVCAAGPEFGCVRVAPHGPVDAVASAASAIVLALGVAVLRRRRAR